MPSIQSYNITIIKAEGRKEEPMKENKKKKKEGVNRTASVVVNTATCTISSSLPSGYVLVFHFHRALDK